MKAPAGLGARNQRRGQRLAYFIALSRRIDRPSRPTTILGVIWTLIVLESFLASGIAATLPIRTYRIVDGLLRDQVTQIMRDSHGYLWICTREGFSRFDGYGFTNYGPAQGLPFMRVNDMIETRDGEYWLATDKGACEFRPSALKDPSDGHRFVLHKLGTTLHTQTALALAEAPGGKILCGTIGGLFEIDREGGRRKSTYVDLGIPVKNYNDVSIQDLLTRDDGTTWIGATSGLFRRWPDGHIDRYTTQHGLPANGITVLCHGGHGELLVGTTEGLCWVTDAPRPGGPIVSRVLSKKDGLIDNEIISLLQASDGTLWIGTYFSLCELHAPATGGNVQLRNYTVEDGLSYPYPAVNAITEDDDGDLWLGTESDGVMKIAGNGLRSFGGRQGLDPPRIGSIFEDAAGQLCVFANMGGVVLSYFDGRRFLAVHPNWTRPISAWGWGTGQVALQDHAGEWWIPTGEGVFRFPRAERIQQLDNARPMAFYTTRDGLSGNDILRLFEDSRHDIWISAGTPTRKHLNRWDRATGTFHVYTQNVPEYLPTAFHEDRHGNLWIGFYAGGLVRYRNQQFELFAEGTGFETSLIYCIFEDHTGRLWVATSKDGVFVMDDPNAKVPPIRRMTAREGLSSMEVTCITEDRLGRIYFGTARGVDRLEPGSGRVRPYTTADGLSSSYTLSAFRDRQGTLWFGSLQGISSLTTQPDRSRPPPPILICSATAGGVDYPISEVGEQEVKGIEIARGRSGIEIAFLGIDISHGDELRYQYRLDGVDTDWSAASRQRSVSYPVVPPGRYRFAVRAVNSDEQVSPVPAVVSFTVLPPLWRRWWFLLISMAAVTALIYAVFRYRVARLIELERVRTRIATDLHDDIGASLSHIAILSEVARQRIDRDNKPVAEPLTRIAEVSRELVDSMGDIVWSINPQRDHLSDLVLRMRKLAGDILTYKDIAFEFEAPGSDHDMKIGAELRRQVFLIFKESLNNLARHSGCTEAHISLRITNGVVEMKLVDNGRGFDTAMKSSGHGRGSMAMRARSLGGTLDVVSRPGGGTAVSLRAPLAHRRAGL